MDDEKKVLICHRVAEFPDGPPAESYVDTCEKCKRAIWHAYTSPPTDVTWCADCAFAEIKANKGVSQFEPPTEEQMAEVRRWRD